MKKKTSLSFNFNTSKDIFEKLSHLIPDYLNLLIFYGKLLHSLTSFNLTKRDSLRVDIWSKSPNCLYFGLAIKYILIPYFKKTTFQD